MGRLCVVRALSLCRLFFVCVVLCPFVTVGVRWRRSGSFRDYLCLFLFVCVCLWLCVSVSMSVCVSVCVCFSVCLSVCRSPLTGLSECR